jgi:glycosyltransferase involved in cell wall biosynthesis
MKPEIIIMQDGEKSAMIITYNMIPYARQWGACQRMYFLADYLQDHGYDVYVVHTQRSEYLGDYGHPIRFHSIPIISQEAAVSSGNNSTMKNDSGGRFATAAVDFAKSIIKKLNLLSLERMVFNEPNLGMGVYGYLFSKSAREKIFRTISEQKIRHVIISGPPFSLFRLGPQIKMRFPEVNIILDYRDPWNTPYLSYRISSLIERNALRYADKVVFLNDRMLHDISSKYNLPREKCVVVLNGYSKQDWNEVCGKSEDSNHDHPQSDKMTIAYIGSTSFMSGGYRDLSSFLEAFKTFQENKNVCLRFVGVTPSDAAEKVKSQFPGTLEILPPVDAKTALKYMLESDVLFLNHTDDRTGRYVLTGKFFDYIRSGKVILGTASSESTYFVESIQKYHLGLGCLTQPTQISECLELLYDKWMKGSLGELRKDDGLNIEELSREFQNGKYLQLLEDLESNKSAVWNYR